MRKLFLILMFAVMVMASSCSVSTYATPGGKVYTYTNGVCPVCHSYPLNYYYLNGYYNSYVEECPECGYRRVMSSPYNNYYYVYGSGRVYYYPRYIWDYHRPHKHHHYAHPAKPAHKPQPQVHHRRHDSHPNYNNNGRQPEHGQPNHNPAPQTRRNTGGVGNNHPTKSAPAGTRSNNSNHRGGRR